MIPRKNLFGKLGLTPFQAIESATAFCKLRGNPYVELVHWLHQIQLGVDSDFHRINAFFGVASESVDEGLTAALKRLPVGANSIKNFSSHIELAIERAWVIATLEFRQYKIRTGHLLSALLSTPELRRVLLEICPEMKRIPVDQISELYSSILKETAESIEEAHDQSDLSPVEPGETCGAVAPSTPNAKALEKYCSDLTAQAKEGRIDPVIGREQEIRTMIDILLRRRQNNPLLAGEAGVGKTAVVEGFALAIASKNVPPSLKNIRLLSLDIGALLAGASMKGEFESRLKSVIEEASRSAQPVVLFVDEVHTLIGAGGNAGTGDAANLLKPALARGSLRTIGATTWSEYKKHIEKDAALTRRFQVLQISEPDEERATRMIRGLASTFEQHHGVLILESAIRAAVELSHRYIPSRQLPDKAISLLDTACARVALSLHSEPAELENLSSEKAALTQEEYLLARERQLGKATDEQLNDVRNKLGKVTVQIAEIDKQWEREQAAVKAIIQKREGLLESQQVDNESLQVLEFDLQQQVGDSQLIFPEVNELVIARIVSEWTGIPVGRMVKDEITAVINLSQTLQKRVVGQDAALAMISRRIQVSRAGMSDDKKPVGVFMLVGPSGVGKTETALVLAEALYGGEHNLITINMSEFQEAHTVSTLKGAPPGYVGYGEGGVLTEAVRRRPYSVVLLDEVEKAHRDVHELFFQVFDKGWMEDGEGRHIDFRNTIILLTSNIGSDVLTKLCADQDLIPEVSILRDVLQKELRQVFPAAFLGRTTIVPYLPLRDEIISSIVKIQLDKVARRIFDMHGLLVEFRPEVISYIVDACEITESGARLLIGYVEQKILPLLSQTWLEALLNQQTPERIVVKVREGELYQELFYPPSLT